MLRRRPYFSTTKAWVRRDISGRRFLLGRWQLAFATVYGLEVIDQRLHRHDAGVFAVPVCDLAQQWLSHRVTIWQVLAYFSGDGDPPLRASIPQFAN